MTFKHAHGPNKRIPDEKQWKNNKSELQAPFRNVSLRKWRTYAWSWSATYHARLYAGGARRDSFTILRTCWKRSNDFPAGVTRDCAFLYTPSEKGMDARRPFQLRGFRCTSVLYMHTHICTYAHKTWRYFVIYFERYVCTRSDNRKVTEYYLVKLNSYLVILTEQNKINSTVLCRRNPSSLLAYARSVRLWICKIKRY